MCEISKMLTQQHEIPTKIIKKKKQKGLISALTLVQKVISLRVTFTENLLMDRLPGAYNYPFFLITRETSTYVQTVSLPRHMRTLTAEKTWNKS